MYFYKNGQKQKYNPETGLSNHKPPEHHKLQHKENFRYVENYEGDSKFPTWILILLVTIALAIMGYFLYRVIKDRQKEV